MTSKTLVVVFAAATALVAGSASAEPLSVWVGQTKKVTLSVQIAKVSVDDASILTAKKGTNGVDLVGASTGKTAIHLSTVDGDQYDFVVHVTSEGGRVYEVSR